MGAIFGSTTPPPPPTFNPRLSPLPVIYDLEKIEEKVKDFERTELIRKLTTYPLDENVEHLLEEVLMLLKMLHGEEVGKEVFKYRENLLALREDDLERVRREKSIKIKRVKDIDSSKWTGATPSSGGDYPF